MSAINNLQPINKPVNKIRSTTNKLAFTANILLALLLPFSLTGKIEASMFDYTMVWLYLILCIVNRPNSNIRNALLSVRQTLKNTSAPKQLILKKAYCTGLYIVKFLLRLAMFSILLYHLIIEHIPFFGIYTAKIYGCIILYILMLSNLNLGVNIGRYFSSKLQKRTKISINIICLFPSVTGLYLFYKEGIWKHYIQFKKLPECNLLYYYLVTLFFIQIGFLFYELTIGRESST